jgi:hypothetical protein
MRQIIFKPHINSLKPFNITQTHRTPLETAKFFMYKTNQLRNIKIRKLIVNLFE